MSENNATMSAGMPASAPAFGSDVKRLPLKDLLKRIGPGLIATGIVIGPGAVTTASMIGANYGYDLMWLFFPIIFMGITFMMVTNRLAIVTGMPTIHAIRKYYGPVASGIVGCAMFLSCLFFTMGNISGTGAGMNLIFGLDWKIGSAIMIAVVVYMYFAKNVYSKVEKIITLCIVLMIVAFYATLVGVGGPEPQGLAKGLFGFKVPEGSLSTALAFISTNAAVTAGIYGTYLGKEKKWKKDDLFNGVMLTDAITHIVSVSLISGAIVLVGAVVLHPQGLSIKAPAQLAEMLVPIMGGLYVLVALVVIIMNLGLIPQVFGRIFAGAFDFQAIFAGFTGSAVMQGVKRGLFSNEAGVGSAPNAAASADVSHPVKQGLVQMLSVFLDTLVICSATAFMLLCSGVEPAAELQGAPYVQEALSASFGTLGPIFITVAMVLFAFTTLIGNLYYVDNALAYLLGHVPSRRFMVVFRLMAMGLIFLGAGLTLDLVWNLSDVLMGIMVLINIPVIAILSRPAAAALRNYTRQRKEGKNPVFRAADIGLKEKTDYWN